MLAPSEAVDVVGFEFLNEPQFREGTIEGLFEHDRSARLRWDVCPQEAIDIPAKGAIGDSFPARLVGECNKFREQFLFGELRLGKVIEDPEPRSWAVGGSGQLPVDEPEGADFFEVGI